MCRWQLGGHFITETISCLTLRRTARRVRPTQSEPIVSSRGDAPIVRVGAEIAAYTRPTAGCVVYGQNWPSSWPQDPDRQLSLESFTCWRPPSAAIIHRTRDAGIIYISDGRLPCRLSWRPRPHHRPPCVLCMQHCLHNRTL